MIPGIWRFVQVSPSAPRNALFDVFRERLKTLGWLYTVLVALFSPVLPTKAFQRCLAKTLLRHGENAAILNLGSGPGAFAHRGDIIHVDLFELPGVDMVADISDLPILANSVDLALNVAVLEHIHNPEAVVSQMLRILKPGGEALIFMPFLQPLHAAPSDYTRRTHAGLLNMLNGWEIVESGLGAGPTSSLLWTAQHWLALVLSFGNATLYGFLLPALMLCTWPVKQLDRILEFHPRAADIASGFYVLARKNASCAEASRTDS